jgi:hypothetical protein
MFRNTMDEDGGRMTSDALVSYHNTILRHIPEELDLNLHRRDNLNFRIQIWFEKRRKETTNET